MKIQPPPPPPTATATTTKTTTATTTAATTKTTTTAAARCNHVKYEKNIPLITYFAKSRRCKNRL